jgi:hypothetical protein
MDIKEQIRKTIEEPVSSDSKRSWFKDEKTSETYSLDIDLLSDIPEEFD